MLFVKPRSGGGQAARAGLAERARERGVEAVVLDPGQDLAALARDAAAGGADVLGVAVADAQIALSAVADGLLGLLRSRERHPERVDETSVDQLTEACLRLLGVPASEAARLVASRPPIVGTVSR